MPNKITYTITTSDGQSHQVSRENIDKYGMQAYADAYPGATVRMRDDDKGDYDIPIEHYDGAVGQGLHAFAFEHLPVQAPAKQPAAPTGQGQPKATQQTKEEPGFFTKLWNTITGADTEETPKPVEQHPTQKAAPQATPVQAQPSTTPAQPVVSTQPQQPQPNETPAIHVPSTNTPEEQRIGREDVVVTAPAKGNIKPAPFNMPTQDEAFNRIYGYVEQANAGKGFDWNKFGSMMGKDPVLHQMGSYETQDLQNQAMDLYNRKLAMKLATQIVGSIPQGASIDEAQDAASAAYYKYGFLPNMQNVQDLAENGHKETSPYSGESFYNYVKQYTQDLLKRDRNFDQGNAATITNGMFTQADFIKKTGKEFDEGWMNSGEQSLAGNLMNAFHAKLDELKQAGQKAKDEVMKRETEGNMQVGGREGHAMQLGALPMSERAKNYAEDPKKAIDYVLSKLYGGNSRGNSGGDKSGEDVDREAVGKLIYRKMMQELTDARVPKSQWGYVLEGFADSDLGELLKNYTQTDFQRHLGDLANRKYMQSLDGFDKLLTIGGHEATKFIADAWEWYGAGKVGGAITSGVRNKAIKGLATDLVERGIQADVAKGIAQRVFEQQARSIGTKAALASVGGAGTLGAQAAFSSGLRTATSHVGDVIASQQQREAEGEKLSAEDKQKEIAAADKERHSITNILTTAATSGLRGAGMGATFGLGSYVGSKLGKLASNYMGDVSSWAVEQAGRLTTNSAAAVAYDRAAGTITGQEPEESAADSFASNLVTFGLLDLIGAGKSTLFNSLRTGKGFHPIADYRAWKEHERRTGITEEDQQRMEDAGYGDMLDTVNSLVSERFRRGSTDVPAEWKPTDDAKASRVNDGMIKMLGDDRLPEELKRKYYELVTGDTGKKLSPIVATEVTEDEEGNSYLVTYNKNGGVVSDRKYRNANEAAKAQTAIGHEVDENMTSALQDGVLAKNADALLESAYQRAAEAYKNSEGNISDTDKVMLALYQHREPLANAIKAQASGEPLTAADQSLLDMYLRVKDSIYSHDPVLNDIRHTTEDAFGLGRNGLSDARKGHDRKAAEDMAKEAGEEVVHVGGDVYRTASEQAAVEDYRQRLWDYLNDVRDGEATEVREPKLLEVNAQAPEEAPATPATPGPTGGSGAPEGIQEGGEGASTPGTGSQPAGRRAQAYDRGKRVSEDEASLEQMQYETDLAKRRFTQAFPDGNNSAAKQASAIYSLVNAGEFDKAEELYNSLKDSFAPAQQSTVESLIDAASMQDGIEDSITEQSMEYQQQRMQELSAVADEQGNITPIVLDEGRTVFYKAGDLNNVYGGIIITNENGQQEQVPVRSVKQVGETQRAADMVSAETDQFANDLRSRYDDMRDGRVVVPGQQLTISFGNQTFNVTVDHEQADGSIVLTSEDGSPIALTPNDIATGVANARSQRIEQALAEDNLAMQQKALVDRFNNGIVGLKEGKPDFSAKESDPKVVAEYYHTYGDSFNLYEITNTISNLKAREDQARRELDRQSTWMELNGDNYAPEVKAQKEQIIAEARKTIADAESRRRKWGEIRNAYMTEEQRKAFQAERTANVNKAKDKVKSSPLSSIAVDGISDKDLLDNNATQNDASTYLDDRAREIIKDFDESTGSEMSNLRRQLSDYVSGYTEYSESELTDIMKQLREAEAKEVQVQDQVRQIRNTAKRLPLIYAERNKEALESMSAAERRRAIISRAKGYDALVKAADEAYKDSDMYGRLHDTEPETIEEYVASSLPYGQLNFEGTKMAGGTMSNGLQQETGLSRGIGRGFDSNGINKYLAPKGKGISVAQMAEKIWGDRPSQFENYTDADIRNIILDLLGSAQKATDISHMILLHRIAEVEAYERAREEAERAEIEEEAARRQADLLTYQDYLDNTAEDITLTEEISDYIAGVIADELYEREQQRLTYMDALSQLLSEDEELINSYTNGEEGLGAPGSGTEMDQESGRRSVQEGTGEGQALVPGKEAGQPGFSGTYHAEGTRDWTAGGESKDRHSDADGSVHLDGRTQGLKRDRQEVDLHPTEAQKEAGNYKKGHIKIDGYDVTIENPKGSTRTGKDANGEEWSVPMNYDYGYIRGTKGVDGDHIDVYLSDEPTSGNVYVVDQIDQQTGEFDEHKVMYGFPSMEAAREAYASQYEDGWKIGTITEVSRWEFKKWVDSSTRKTKPFSEYKSVKAEPRHDMTGNGTEGAKTDYQGNPLNEDGSLKVEKLLSVDEITDEDLSKPTRSVELPTLPKNVDKAIGANGKPVIIKKNIFEKNWMHHKFPFEESRTILKSALYNTDLVGQTQPSKKPMHWVAIKLDDKSPIVILEVNEGKDNTEIVGWYTLDARNLERIKRQAVKNGGELVILSSKDKVGSLSTPLTNLSSVGKDTKENVDLQENKDNSYETNRNVLQQPRHDMTGDGTHEEEQEDVITHTPVGQPLRKATQEDLETSSRVWYDGKFHRIMLLIHSGEQVNAISFSKPEITSVIFQDGAEVSGNSINDLYVVDEKREEPSEQAPVDLSILGPITTKTIKNGETRWMVKPTERVDHDVYLKYNDWAKKFGGFYASKFKGYLFKTEDDARSFKRQTPSKAEVEKEPVADVKPKQDATDTLLDVVDQRKGQGEEQPQPYYDYDREDDVTSKVLAELRDVLAKGNGIPNIKAIESQIRDLKKRVKVVEDGLSIASGDTVVKGFETLATLNGRLNAYEQFLGELRTRMKETERDDALAAHGLQLGDKVKYYDEEGTIVDADERQVRLDTGHAPVLYVVADWDKIELPKAKQEKPEDATDALLDEVAKRKGQTKEGAKKAGGNLEPTSKSTIFEGQENQLENYGSNDTAAAGSPEGTSQQNRPLGGILPNGDRVLESPSTSGNNGGETSGEGTGMPGLAQREPGVLPGFGSDGTASVGSDGRSEGEPVGTGRRRSVGNGKSQTGRRTNRRTTAGSGVAEGGGSVPNEGGQPGSERDHREGNHGSRTSASRTRVPGEPSTVGTPSRPVDSDTRLDNGTKKDANERNTPLNTRNYLYPENGADIDNMSESERLKANVEALEILVKLIRERRVATEEERAIIGMFRGWGGIDIKSYHNAEQLKDATRWSSRLGASPSDDYKRRLGEVILSLDPDGKKDLFSSIKQAALTSYYTPLPIAAAINHFLDASGYHGGGTMLDPSMGTGVFEGTMPKDMQQRTRIYGIELDWLTAQLAKQLYPDANIQNVGYQDAQLAKGSFDVVESNIPFGAFKVYDSSWRHDSSPAKKAAQGKIHTYFALKMMESAKPGGLVTIMTSNSIMDTKGNAIIRNELLDQAEFLGALRLPDNTFKGAGTRVVTDVIFLRKYKDESDRETTMRNEDYQARTKQFTTITTVKAQNSQGNRELDVPVNAYFKEHPEMMLGKVVAGGQYREDDFGLVSDENAQELANKMIANIDNYIVGDRKGRLYDTHKTERQIYQAIREAYVGNGDYANSGNIVEQNGKIGVLSKNGNSSELIFEEDPNLNKSAARIRLMIPIRTAMKKLIAAQINRESDDTIAGYRKELNDAYRAFVDKFDILNAKANNFIDSDIDSYQIKSLEDYDPETKKVKRLADIFTKDTIKPQLDITKINDPVGAITTSLAEYGDIRPSFMEKALGEDWANLCGSALFQVPFSENYVVSEDYLSGDVKSKLIDAKRAAEADPKYKVNVEALEKVQPRDIPINDINIRMGARWVPDKVYNDFMRYAFGIPERYNAKSGIRYVPEADDYVINVDNVELSGEADKWRTDRKSVREIFEAAMKDKSLQVFDRVDSGTQVLLNREETQLANDKVQELRETFETWVASDPERGADLEKLYNEKFNRTVPRKWNGDFLNPVGLQGKTLRPHQKAAVWMLMNNQGGIVDHIVGAGKTLVMQSAIMEMRRTGIAKKPMILALKATVGQIAKEFSEAYPAARLLAPTEKDFSEKNRKKLLAKIANNDYDCVIISHEQYVKLPHTEEVESMTFREQFDQLEVAILLLRQSNDTSQLTKRQLKGLQKRKANLEANLKKISDRAVDPEFTFENLGIDYIFVDECQMFKSLPYATTYNQVAGLGNPTGSEKAVALLNGIRYLQQLHQGDRGTVFLSGTTITNSLVEVYNLLNYLRPNMMKKLGYTTFDAWAAQYAVRTSELEYGVSNQLKEKNRFRYFQNVAELGKLYSEIADVRNDANLKLPKPEPRTHLVAIEPSDKLSEINSQITHMIQAKDASYFPDVKQSDDPKKTPWSLMASTLSTKASVSPRLIFPDLPDEEHGKIAVACKNVIDIYKKFDKEKGTQLIFCDTGVAAAGKPYDAYSDIINRLVEAGIPRKEIVDIHVANTDDKRKALFKKVLEGSVRVLIGGTKNMGTGVNVQTRLVALHHIDIPWQPADVEQRNGRGVRQGNELAKNSNDNKVELFYYAVKGSLDMYRYQLQDIKGKMFTQFKLNTIDSDSAREFDEGEIDADGNIDPAQMVAILSGNPVIFEKSKQDKLVKKLMRQQSAELSDWQRRKRNDEHYETRKSEMSVFIEKNNADIKKIKENGFVEDDKGQYPSSYKIVMDDGTTLPWKKVSEAGEIINKLITEGKKFHLEGFGVKARVQLGAGQDMFGQNTLVLDNQTGWNKGILYQVSMSGDSTADGVAFRRLLKKVLDNHDVYAKKMDDYNHKLQGKDTLGQFEFSKQEQLEKALQRQKELNAEYRKLSEGEDTKAPEAQPDSDRMASRGTRRKSAREMMANLSKAEAFIEQSFDKNTKGRFYVDLPAETEQKIRKATGTSYVSHSIVADNIRHANNNHGVDGKKLTTKSIPLTHEDFKLIPYIITAPDRVIKGSVDNNGRESIRFVKYLSNGLVIVVEKEHIKRPSEMETITAWADMSSEVLDARSEGTSPELNVRNVILGSDAAKIRKDAENAVNKDEKDRLMQIETIQRAARRAGDMLGGTEVNFADADSHKDADADMRRKRGDKGFYDPKTGEVVLFPENIVDEVDAARTVFHEKAGHEGLKALLGSQQEVDKFGQFIFENAGKKLRARIIKRADAEGYGWDDALRFSKAAQEEFADIASEGPATQEEFSLWRKIKHYLIKALKKLGIRIPGILNDQDLRYYTIKTSEALKNPTAVVSGEREHYEGADRMASRGKPRQRKGETMSQYIERLKEWEKWKRAEEASRANDDPMPEKADYDAKAEEDFARALSEWKAQNGISAEESELGPFPKRADGESPQEYAVRVADWETRKDAWQGAPNYFDYMQAAQDQYRDDYTAWKTRYDLNEEAQVDMSFYEGRGSEPQTEEEAAEQADLERRVDRDLGVAVGIDLTPEGARRKAKLAVIERRKNLESASAEDAIFIHDIGKEISNVAKSLGMKDKDLRSQLIDVIENPLQQLEGEIDMDHWVEVLNRSFAFNDAHTYITPESVQSAYDELQDLYSIILKNGVRPENAEQRKEIFDAAVKLAHRLGLYYEGVDDYNRPFSDTILRVTKWMGKLAEAQLMANRAHTLSDNPEVQGLVSKIHDWYDEFFHLIEDAGLRGDAGYISEGYVNHIWSKEKSDPEAYERYVENYQRTKSPNMRKREIATYVDGISVGLVPKYDDILSIMAYYSRSNNEAIANKKFLDDLSFLCVEERNKDGEVVNALPLLSSVHPSVFNRERYVMYHVPGVGDVWVLKDVQRRFSSIFGTMRTQDVPDWLSKVGKAYDTGGSVMKKIQLSFSGFHAGALTEVAIAQMRPDRGMKALMQYVILDSIKTGTLPAYAHPDDFREAAKHLVQLGATQDYAAADVNNITEKFRDYAKSLSKDENFVKATAGKGALPLAVVLDYMNKGMDKMLWNYLHDGLKLACFKMFKEHIEDRVRKQGLSDSQREQLLDEAGQYVNDTFGGQYWELLNVSPAALKWMRRALLSPDWLISTQRHFSSMFGFGSLYSEGGFRTWLQYNVDNTKRAFGADIPRDENRRLRSEYAKKCYILGVCLFFYTLMNGLNAAFRAKDEADEKAKADEIRNTQPDYMSPYELAYPEGMKWYDYTMLGNGLGHQTHLFVGRYKDGSETYVRWGKQFREFPEMFIGRKGLEFPAPMIERMMGKSNPMISLVRDNLGALGIWGYDNSSDIAEIQAKYGKTIGVLAANAKHFLPFSLPTQADKEFKMVDLVMPSQKGFSRYKTVDYFKDFIKSGDSLGVARTYRAAVMNGIDAEACLKAAISTLKAEQREELLDGITDLSSAYEAYDKATTLTEKKHLKNKLHKYLAESNYKQFTREDALQMIEDYQNGDDVPEKESDLYLMRTTAEDIRDDYRLSAIGKQAKKYVKNIKEIRESGDEGRARQLSERYQSWIIIDRLINAEHRQTQRLKKQFGKGNDAAIMQQLRQLRQQTQHEVDAVEPPR